jgi:hypothetical protein
MGEPHSITKATHPQKLSLFIRSVPSSIVLVIVLVLDF